MRKPRDIDAELKALAEKTKLLKERRVLQLGELVIATGADSIDAETLAGALLVIAEAKDAAKLEAWRKRGEAFFQRKGVNAGKGTDQQSISAGSPGPARLHKRFTDINAGYPAGRHDPTKGVSVARFAGQSGVSDQACKHILGHRTARDLGGVAVARLRELRCVDAEQADLGPRDTQGVAIDDFGRPFDDLSSRHRRNAQRNEQGKAGR